MIVREILSLNSDTVIEKFDFFNDYEDTARYLRNCGGDIAGPVGQKLTAAYEKWHAEKFSYPVPQSTRQIGEQNFAEATARQLDILAAGILPLPAPAQLGESDTFDLLNPHPDQIDTFAKKMRWFAMLSLAKRDQDEFLDKIKEKIAELEPHLLEEMALNGVDRQTIDGLTIYPQTDLIVSKKADKDGVTQEVLCDALRKCGLAYMVGESYSASSLKSKVKEWRESNPPIEVPAELAPLINVIEKQKLVTRKA